MRTLKIIAVMILVISGLTACASNKPTNYTKYVLNATKTVVLVKSYKCEDVMNDSFDFVSDYLAQPPVLCKFSTLELDADSDSFRVHAVYEEPNYFTLTPSDTEIEVFSGSVTELSVTGNLGLPSTLEVDKAGTITFDASGSVLYDKGGRKISTGTYVSLNLRPMMVVDSVYKAGFTDPSTSVDNQFDAKQTPDGLAPDADYVTSYSGSMTVTIPQSVSTRNVCFILWVSAAHFSYVLYVYYEGQA